jgi:hypothetical protein
MLEARYTSTVGMCLKHLMRKVCWKACRIFFLLFFPEPSGYCTEAESKEKHGVWDPNAGVDYNLTLCPLQSRLQHIYHGKPYARVDFVPRSGTLDLASGDTQGVMRDKKLFSFFSKKIKIEVQ